MPTTRPGVLMALDVGDARIGVAKCDPDRLLATPVETVPAGRKATARIIGLLGEYAPVELLIGLPRSLSGQLGPAAVKMEQFAQALQDECVRAGIPIGIRFIDERMTTVTAEQQLRQMGKKGAKRRAVVDQAAAVIILQSALDRWRSTGDLPGELRAPGPGSAAKE